MAILISTFHPILTRTVLPAAACAAVLGCSGCGIAAPQVRTDARVHPPEDVAVNSEQMRLRMRSLVQPMSGVIVAAADEIMAGTADRSVRRHALLWKIDAVSALREALFQANPTTAVMDAWVLTYQMGDYFEAGPGKAGLGGAHDVAVTTCRQLEDEMARVAATMAISGDVSRARAFARSWAAAHPIVRSIAARESTLSRVTELDVADSLSAREIVGNASVTIDDLNRRLEIYSAQLPEQARWQAELLAMDLAQKYELERAMPLAEAAVKSAGRAADAADRAVPALERAVAVAETAPGLLTAERKAVTGAVSDEVTRALAFVRQERILTLGQIADERVAATRDVRDVIAGERQAIVLEADRMSVRVVDHAFRRLGQVVGAALAAAFVGVALLLCGARRLFVGRPNRSTDSGTGGDVDRDGRGPGRAVQARPVAATSSVAG